MDKRRVRVNNTAAHNNLKNQIMVELCREFHGFCFVSGRSVGTFIPYKGTIPVHIGVKGEPDIYALVRGKSFFIEVKTGTGRLNPDQKRFKAMCEKSGGFFIEARSVDDAILGVSQKLIF